jgi:multisubunit Na+/H+ antiporter MnhE subunit
MVLLLVVMETLVALVVVDAVHHNLVEQALLVKVTQAVKAVNHFLVDITAVAVAVALVLLGLLLLVL